LGGAHARDPLHRWVPSAEALLTIEREDAIGAAVDQLREDGAHAGVRAMQLLRSQLQRSLEHGAIGIGLLVALINRPRRLWISGASSLSPR
jgi:hypothetical protein